MTHQLFVWLMRAWPVLGIAFLGGVHLSILAALSTQAVLVNKLTGTTMQVVGGLIVLHAMNQNLGLFRRQSLVSVVVAWLHDFPFAKRSNTVLLTGVGSIGLTGSASGTVKRAVTTVEERLAEAERQIEEVRALVVSKSSELGQRIDSVKAELSLSIASNESSVKKLTDTIERATVGGFKEQSFGVLLAVYGAVVSVFA